MKLERRKHLHPEPVTDLLRRGDALGQTPGRGADETATRRVFTSRSSTIPFSFNSSVISSKRHGVDPYIMKFSRSLFRAFSAICSGVSSSAHPGPGKDTLKTKPRFKARDKILNPAILSAQHRIHKHGYF